MFPFHLKTNLSSTGKADNLSRRNEKLARRNPDRLQKQLDELKSIETSGGTLTKHEKSVLEGLERDLKAVRRARDVVGSDGTNKNRSGVDARGARDSRDGRFDGRDGGRGGGVLGKRRRDRDEEDENGSEDDNIPEEIKSIPMPRDTPPPIAKEILDKWYSARRERLGLTQNQSHSQNHNQDQNRGSNANNIPLGRERNLQRGESSTPQQQQQPQVEAKTTYSSAPVIRNLRKEAVSFVPAAVRVKMEKSRGVGGLMEPEEAERLEREGYLGSGFRSNGGGIDETRAEGAEGRKMERNVQLEEVKDVDG